jgi:hypothetical protein
MTGVRLCQYRLTNIRRKDGPIKHAVKDRIMVALAPLALAACHVAGAPAASAGAAAGPSQASEADYQPPPALAGVVREAGGRLRLNGVSGPGDRLRLATPQGQAVFALAGKSGRWSLSLATPAEPRLFGLAAVRQARAVQSEGYLAVTPEGEVAQLRSGAGARVLGDEEGDPVILAVDFDAKGGTVVSGRAAPRATLDLLVDGAHAGRGAAGADGLFSVPLDEPLTFADHRLSVVDGPRHAEIVADVSTAAAPTGSPYKAAATGSGWRIDWITPGGGLQTTLLPRQIGGRS